MIFSKKREAGENRTETHDEVERLDKFYRDRKRYDRRAFVDIAGVFFAPGPVLKAAFLGMLLRNRKKTHETTREMAESVT